MNAPLLSVRCRFSISDLTNQQDGGREKTRESDVSGLIKPAGFLQLQQNQSVDPEEELQFEIRNDWCFQRKSAGGAWRPFLFDLGRMKNC